MGRHQAESRRMTIIKPLCQPDITVAHASLVGTTDISFGRARRATYMP
jgi:hypothetical protein